MTAQCGSVTVYSGKGNNISNYRTVVIGTQTWMAENLDYVVEGSKCYNNDPANCNTYGSLYNWATAMNLPSSCTTSSCSSQIQSKHQGICPSGWHIPSSEDWGKLSRYVDGTSGTFAGYVSSTAGKHLKAQSGWNPYSGIENLDTYGFRALPGGSDHPGDFFSNVGDNGRWWSASEGYSEFAYIRDMYYDVDYAYWSGHYKFYLYSVRCLKD
jgi:uncharacterized protein (TIGR02145 family)